MAIIYSYPLAEEVTNDSWVLGSEMDNGMRVVKNYSVGDIAAFIESQFTTAPTLQEVTEEGANTTVQMQINGVDVATVNDITGTPTLQEVVAEGNTVSGGAYINVTNGSLSTLVQGGNVNVSNAANTMDVFASGLLFQKQFGSGSVELKFPNTINDTRVIEFPNASGTIALTNDIPTPTLQQVTDEGSDSYGNNINLKQASNSDSLIQFNVGSFFEPYIKIENAGEGSGGHYMRLGSSTIEFNGDEDYNTIIEVGTGLNNTVTLPSESGTLALIDDIPTPPYRVYTALINQSGTTAPFVIEVLENTLSGTVTFEYTNPGLYYAVLAGEFGSNRTTAMLWGGTSSQLFKAARVSFDNILLVTYDTSGIPANNQMGVTTLEIRVYNE